MKNTEEQHLHLIRETVKVFNGEPISFVKIFDEFYDFYDEPLNLYQFRTYIEEELVGIYSIEAVLVKSINHFIITKL